MLLRGSPEQQRKGVHRFDKRAFPRIYRIKKKISSGTFIPADLADPDKKIGFRQPVNANLLVKTDLPELALERGVRRVSEAYRPTSDTWVAYQVERYCVDGTVGCNCL